MKFATWNYNKIDEQVKMCEKALLNNPYDMDFLCDLEVLETLVSDDLQVFPTEDFLGDQLKEDYDDYKAHYEFFYPMKKYLSFAKKINNKHEVYFNEVELKDSMIIAFVHDFFNQLDKEWRKPFNKVFKERYNNFKFCDERSCSVYLPGNNYYYIQSQKSNTISDMIDPIHEYGHVISNSIHPYIGYNQTPFIELLSLFLEFIACDYIEENYEFGDETDAYKLNLAKSLTNYINDLRLQELFFTVIDKKHIDIDDLKSNTMKQLLTGDRRSTMESLSYSIPYMVIIELYTMYKEDPERTVYVINQIIHMHNKKSYLKELEKYGVVLNEHSRQFVKKLTLKGESK